MSRIELSEEAYNDFLRCLTNLKEICNDIDIQDGIIRQRSNDLTSIFEMDLTSLIGNAKIPITDIKKKLELLKLFVGHDVYIDIESGETESDSYFIVSDDDSSIKFSFPSSEFMDNKIMTKEELNEIFNLDEEDLILTNDLNSVITDRIKIITLNFNTQAIQVKFVNDIASIIAMTQAKDQFATFKTNISMNIDFNGTYISNLSTIPFSIEHDIDLTFKMYKDPSQNVSLNKITTELGSVSVNVYSRSAIIEE